MGNNDIKQDIIKFMVAYDTTFDCFYDAKTWQIISDNTIETVMKHKYPTVKVDAEFIKTLKILMENTALPTESSPRAKGVKKVSKPLRLTEIFSEDRQKYCLSSIYLK